MKSKKTLTNTSITSSNGNYLITDGSYIGSSTISMDSTMIEFMELVLLTM